MTLNDIDNLKAGSDQITKVYHGAELIWPIQLSDVCENINGVHTADTNPFSDNSLVAKYLFDNTADDLLGNHNGTIYGSTSYVAGKFNQAVDFGTGKQTSNYVRINNVPVYQNMTYSIWFNQHLTNTSINTIFSLADSGTDNRILVWLNTGGTWLSIRVNNASDRGITFNYEDNVWNHLVVALSSNGTNYIYLNGDFLGTITSGPVGTSYSGNNILILGQEQDCRGGCFDSNQNFRGALDQFEIFNKVLNQDEVCALYKTSLTPVCDGIDGVSVEDTDPFSDGSLIAKYLFENNTDDLLGNYNGSVSGNTTYEDGKFGKSVYLIGASANDRIVTNMPVNFPLTISYWAKNATPYKGIGNYNYNGYSGNAQGFGFRSTKTRVEYAARGPTLYFNYSDLNIGDDEWYHVAFNLIDSSTYPQVYINGNLISDISGSTGGIYSSSVAFGFGYEQETNYGDMSGTLDHVEIFNRVLSQDEVCALYKTTSEVFSIPQHSGPESDVGIASAESEYTSSYGEYRAWKCWDKNNTGNNYRWAAQSYHRPTWIQYEFKQLVYLYQIRYWGKEDESPKNYEYQISLDGTDWTTIKTFENEIYEETWSPWFNVASDRYRCKYFRIWITETQSSAYCSISEIEIEYTL